MATDTPRPRSDADSELGFTKAKPVHWLRPGMLTRTAINVALSDTFGEFLDKRDLQASLPDTIFHEGSGAGSGEGSGVGDGSEVWFDFVADLGDGFDATYSIAYLIAQDRLDVDGHELRHGDFLVMGGDEVYPTPSWQRYGDKTRGPYEAALPDVPPAGPRNLYALPGNHDWYDSLTSFMRMFAKDGTHRVGGWCNRQSRSYFAIELPGRWWLLAIDTQFGVYVDQAQLNYFRAVAARFQPGDRVILCAPTPAWVEAVAQPGAYDAIDYFVRTVLWPAGARVRLMLSGDLHHYAHYRDATDPAGRQLIHCGGGGAYLYPTHRLPERIPVPPPVTARTRKQSEPTRDYALAATFPTKARSRRYATGVLARLPLGNPGFIGLLGGVHTAFMLAFLGLFTHVSGLTRRWLELPEVVMVAAMLAVAIVFALVPTGGTRNHGRRWLFGTAHGLVHVGLGVLGTWAWSVLPLHREPWPAPIFATLIYFAVAGIVATFVFCIYLLAASAGGVNVNELFSSQAIEDSKSFLRLHIATDGTLTVHPIAVPRVSHAWQARPDAPGTSWLAPKRPIRVRPAEEPIVIR